MNKRILSVIHDIAHETTPVTLDYLASKYQVSQRTVRNDINTINDVLNENGLGELRLKNGIVYKNKDFGEVFSYTGEGDYYTYKLSQEERKQIAAVLLIQSSEYITLSSIADNLFVSRATVINDLEGIKEFIRQGRLEVVSHPNKGLRVEGKELDKRKFLMRLVDSGSSDQAAGGIGNQINIYAGNILIIRKIVSEQENIYKRFLTDESYLAIVQYLGILVSRNMQGEYIEPQPERDESCYLMAADILKYISQYCDIVTTEDEVRYFSYFLSRVRCIKRRPMEQKTLRIQMFTRRFIEHISDELEVNLNNDYDFFENLSNHLISVFTVDDPEYKVNDIIVEVIESNKDILDAVEKNREILEKYAGRPIRDIEFGYIAVHICAAIERRKNKEVAFHVVVACHAGIGTSQLLLERLKKHFNFQIVDIISAHNARNIDPETVDFVISTVPLNECSVEYVVVSALITDEDYVRIGNKIDTLRNSRHLPSRIEKREFTASGMIEALAPVIKDIAPEKEEELMKRIKKTVRLYFRQPVEAEAEIFAPYLHHLLKADHIELDVECRDWCDAIRRSAAKLLDEGYIEERYIDAMIENIEENGPYVVISPGFAIPHAGLEMGSVRVGMNLIRLKEPVVFEEEETGPVEFICCLSATDHKAHLKAFFNLVNILQKDGFKKALHECSTPHEAEKLIERFEYTLDE